MNFAHRIACVKPQFPGTMQKKHKNIGFYRNYDFENVGGMPETLVKQHGFAHQVAH